MADKNDIVRDWTYRATKSLILGADGENMASASNPLPVDAVVSVDSMSLTSEMKVDSGHDLYLAENVSRAGDLSVDFDSITGLDLVHVQAVENKTKGWVYNTKGATVSDTNITLVSGNQDSGYPVIASGDEIEVVYRGDSRFDGLATQATLLAIKENTDKLKFDTDDLKITGSVTTDVDVSDLATEDSLNKLKILSGETAVLLSAAQELTDEWVTTTNISTIDVVGFNKVGIFVTPTKNDSEDCKIRLRAKLGDNYFDIDGLEERTVFGSGDAPLKYFEFHVGILREVIVQVKADTPGASPGTLDIGLIKAYEY